jgi:predicted  nucleic acid-binding Zn-ribbon protein
MSELKLTLEALQLCEAEAEELSRQAAHLPVDIEAALARAAAARAAVEAETEKLAVAEHLRREKEAEVQDCEARREKYQGQTALVKTNTEYTTLLHEIEMVTQRISSVEEEILVAMETAEDVQTRLETLAVEKKREEEGCEREAEALRRRLVDVESGMADHEKDRGRLLAELPVQTRTMYERVRKSTGTGTTSIVGQACTACHRDIPLETINRSIAGELMDCPHCQRILVVPDS